MKTDNKETIVTSLINDGGSATFAQITAVVEEKQNKRGNPFANAIVTKKVVYNILLNANYQNMVNNKRDKQEKESDFQAKQNWFEKVNDGKNGSIVRSIKNPDQKYLFFACNKAETIEHYIDGVVATTDEVKTIKQFKPKVTDPAKYQGLNDGDGVIVRTIKMTGIKEVRAKGSVLNFKD